MADGAPPGGWAALVPELACSDLARSEAFYVDQCGFSLCYTRPGFRYLALGPAQLMLEQAPGDWNVAPMQRPFGRGVNFQIEVADAAGLYARLAEACIDPFRPLADNWYRAGDVEHGQREFLVQDPDGYLLRFVTVLGNRPVDHEARLG